MQRDWETHLEKIVNCGKCPRLREHCAKTAALKKRAHLGEPYWGRPVPTFGPPDARLVILGLAPAAHGANRTGRMFTGDNSGLWLYRALHKAGFANQPQATHADDGLRLQDALITATARCAPPGNKPTPGEIGNCRPFLEWELTHLENAKVYLALGGIAFSALAKFFKAKGLLDRAPKFGHGAAHALKNGKVILCSYHPSQQNTFTGRLTEPMLDSVFMKARELIHARL